jgi:hypothetical protein
MPGTARRILGISRAESAGVTSDGGGRARTRILVSMRRTTGLISIAVFLSVASTAHAVPGPDSVAVLANASVPGSVAMAMHYAAARDVPSRQVCALPMPTTDTITQAEFETMILAPLRTCLGPDVEARIEAVVVMRGVPLRVTIPQDGGHMISITAAIGTWRSTLMDDVTPLLGTSPGQTVMCGTTPCYAARVTSPYSSAAEVPFEAGFEHTIGTIHHRPVLATMLHGRSDADADGLIDTALAAEMSGMPAGEFVLMHGADSARGALDSSYPAVSGDLMTRGRAVSTVPFDTDFTGHVLAGFAVGTASLGMTIEGNTYVRGALVDNLTSFGAVPGNFAATGESQVSIARWVAEGVGGVHGTVDEPLNNCFPARRYLVTYVDGATLAESFVGALPYTYWLNLVVGDPMLAPYAQRPTVTITGAADDATLSTATMLHVVATPPTGRTIAHLVLLADGVEVASADGAVIDHCLVTAVASNVQLLAVATTAPGAMGTPSLWAAKGWDAIHVHETAASTTCPPPVDAATTPDAGTTSDGSVRADASSTSPPAASCGCRAGGSGQPSALLALLALALARRGRRA